MPAIALEPFRRDTPVTNYMPLPREILTMDLPKSAVLLYCTLLDRGTLSQKNNYTDSTGWIYVIYTIEDLAKELCITYKAVQRNLKLLEETGLVLRTRPAGNRASHIFLNIPAGSVMTSSAGQKRTPSTSKMSSSAPQKCPTNNLTEQHDFNDYDYQHSEEESL